MTSLERKNNMDPMIFGVLLGLAMGVVNLFKKTMPEKAVSIVSFVAFLLLSAIWAWLYQLDVRETVQQALLYGGPVLGLYVAGDALRNSPKTPFITERKNATD